MNKATYKGKCKDKNGYAVHLFYEYRGHEYMITDEHNGYSESMYTKHKIEQERIDKLISERQNNILPGTWDDSILDILFKED